MISTFFDRITRLSLRFRWFTVGIALMILVAGVWAMTHLNLELLPRIEFPQTVVVVQWPDATSSSQFLEEVTVPLEKNLGPESIDGVVNVESTTSTGFAFIIVRNDFGLNQETILQEIEAQIAQTDLPETAVPQVLNFSLSDLPIVVASISSSELTLAELKERVQADLEPSLTGLTQVSQVSINGGQELPTPDVVAAEPVPTAAAQVEPGRLPLVVTQGAKQFGLDIKYAQDVTPDVLAGLEGTEEDILAVLNLIPADVLPYAPPQTLVLLPKEYIDTLDPTIIAELNALVADSGSVGQYGIEQAYAIIKGADPETVIAAVTPTAEPTAVPTAEPTAVPVSDPIALPEFAPVALPDSWVAGAAAMGQPITDTSDISMVVMAGILNFAPQQLADLTPEMWRALDPEVTAVALSTAADITTTLDTLDPSLLTQLQAIQRSAAGETAEPLDLPTAWVAQAAYAGFTITTTSDLSPAVITLVADNAPELMDTLTPEMLLTFTPQMLAALPESYVGGLDAGWQQTLTNMGIAAERYLAVTGTETTTEASEGGSRLPDELIQGMAMAGLELEFANDITPEMMQMLTDFGPMALQALALLTPDNLRALPPETIAWLPPDFVSTLDADVQVDLDNLAAEFGGAGTLAATAVADAEPADPARLPDLLIQGASMAGMEIEFASDVTPDMIRLFAGLGEQGVQALSLLTPDNLRLLSPEVVALLPMDFLDTLDTDLRAELDTIAADFGGAGQLALTEAEAAAAMSAIAPPLAGIWLEPAPDGTPSQFQTAADILQNPFVPGAANFLNFFPTAPNIEDPAVWISSLSPEAVAFLAENEAEFVTTLSPTILEWMSSETLTFLLDTYPDAFDADLTTRLRGIAGGEIKVFIPEASITRTDGNPAVIVNIFKDGDANTVEVAHRVFDFFAAYKTEHPEIETNLVFEQATFIEDSVAGVSREGALGAGFAVLVILLFLSGQVGGRYKLSWRATLVTAVSIPLSIFTAFLVMHLVPPVGSWLQGLTESSHNILLTFVSRLFPTSITLNIMTLSGMTVAIGRVVDDSIVVLENSYRYIQRGDDPKTAVLRGTREVAIAIFSATATTVAVFLPLGLIGGLIGSFFLPFGLTVTYALAASFIVSITVVPALTYLLIRKEHIPEEKETGMQRWYTPALEWALSHRFMTMLISTFIFLGSLLLLGQLPRSFIPSIGEPTINTTVTLPSGTAMADTDVLVTEFETAVQQLDGVDTVQVEIGSSGGFEAFFGGSGVSQNLANITISTPDQDNLTALTQQVRQEAEAVFDVDNVVVSAASQTGFGGFSLILTGESLDQLRTVVGDVKTALGSVDVDGDGVADIVNVQSNIDNSGGDGNDTIIRVDGLPAVSFSADLETENTLGVTAVAKEAVYALDNLPAGVTVSEGFESEQQIAGFQSMVHAIGYSILIVYLIMALTFRSLIHPFTILFSLPFALVGAALALFLTHSVLGISAMIGLMMLVGIVVTNGIVLMELVQQLRKQGETARAALVRGGRTRLRPIWMTALAAILALIPLAASQESGAIIASELARAVMGGLLVSTALTLLVVPVVYSLLDEVVMRLRKQR